MSSFAIKVDVLDNATPQLVEFVSRLTDRRGLNERIGLAGMAVTRKHLKAISSSRHATAQRLGANPSGFWGAGTDKTSFRSDSDGTTITVSHPGISRAMRDVTITPGGGKKYLAIPRAAEAYNKRAADWPKGELFVIHPGTKLFLARKDGTKAKVMYRLLPSVTQKQDRSLLPSDGEFQVAAHKAVMEYGAYLRSRLGRAN